MLKRHENKLPVSKDTGFKLMENTLEAYKTSNNCYKTFWYIQPGSIRNRWAHFLSVFHTNSKIVKEGSENKKREKESFSICSSHIGKFWKPPTHSNYMVLLHWEINYYSSIRGADKHLIFQKCLGFLYVVSLTKASRLSGKKKKSHRPPTFWHHSWCHIVHKQTKSLHMHPSWGLPSEHRMEIFILSLINMSKSSLSI